MALLDKSSRTIKCDNPTGDCAKEITFDRVNEKATFENPANLWLKSLRMIQTLDQRVFAYCSDVCEIAGSRSGQHNLPEPKKIIEAGNSAAIEAAARAAQAATASDAAIKSGSGGPVIVEG